MVLAPTMLCTRRPNEGAEADDVIAWVSICKQFRRWIGTGCIRLACKIDKSDAVRFQHAGPAAAEYIRRIMRSRIDNATAGHGFGIPHGRCRRQSTSIWANKLHGIGHERGALWRASECHRPLRYAERGIRIHFDKAVIRFLGLERDRCCGNRLCAEVVRARKDRLTDCARQIDIHSDGTGLTERTIDVAVLRTEHWPYEWWVRVAFGGACAF